MKAACTAALSPEKVDSCCTKRPEQSRGNQLTLFVGNHRPPLTHGVIVARYLFLLPEPDSSPIPFFAETEMQLSGQPHNVQNQCNSVCKISAHAQSSPLHVTLVFLVIKAQPSTGSTSSRVCGHH